MNRQVGHYQILSLIGKGGMGEVYRARDTRLDREVAIKSLPVAYSADSDRLRRFEQEARAAGKLNHPNVLTVYDTVMHDDAPYIVAELLEGEDLRTRLKQGAVAFTPHKGGRTRLYLMTENGTGVREVAGDLDVRGAPAWSPDSWRWRPSISMRGGLRRWTRSSH